MCRPGVDFCSFGFIVHESNFTLAFVRGLYDMPEAEIARRRNALAAVAARYSLGNALSYAARQAARLDVEIAARDDLARGTPFWEMPYV